MLPLRRGAAAEREEVTLPPPDLAPPTRIRMVLGPQDDHFTASRRCARCSAAPTRSRAPPTAWACGSRARCSSTPRKGYNIVSDGIALGSIQVPGNGLPIILLADRQTTGGYPKVATVISADMPALGRMTPGSKIAFGAVDIETAEAAARQLGDTVRKMSSLLVPARRQVVIDPARLLRENLISGAIDARSSEA